MSTARELPATGSVAAAGPNPVLQLGGSSLPLTQPARFYVCGITPYDVTHLGHASTFVWADALRRVVGLAGVEAETVRNTTDVDDVLTRAASERGAHYDSFGLVQEFYFEQDMTALAVAKPTRTPHARHHITHVVRLAEALIAVDAAYARDGHVYFRGAAVPQRAGLDTEQALLLAAEYGDDPQDPLRENPFDVPIWNPSDGEHPGWPSPWGHGRPGWHAECAAMALATVGGIVDVLVGGADLAFPHHAYQSAMVAAATGAGSFARRQMHVGTVSVAGAKMAKSTGNLVLVSELLASAPAAAVRLLLLNRPWAQPWEYQPAALDAAAAALEQLHSAAGRPGADGSAAHAVQRALFDELDVPGALAVATDSGGEAARLLLRTLVLD